MLYCFLPFILIFYVVLPMMLYRRDCPAMGRFCYYMRMSDNFRRFYGINILMVVIYIHILYYNIFHDEYRLIASTVLMFVMFRTSLVLKIVRTLVHDNRKLYIFFLVILASLFIPYLFTFGVSLAVILIGAAFYPSERMMSLSDKYVRDEYEYMQMTEDYKPMIDYYFD